MAKASNRYGVCSDCEKEEVFLLAKNPPRCAACYRASVTGQEQKTRKPKLVEKPKPAPRPKKAAPKGAPRRRRTGSADITREVNAIEQVAQAVEDLTPREIERVFHYVLLRYGQTHGVQIGGVHGIPALPLDD